MSHESPFRLIIVAPVYDDAASASQFLGNLQKAFSIRDIQVSILLVDDGSPRPLVSELSVPAGLMVEVLRLKRNVGHQRGIALGIAYLHEHKNSDAILVMDADGEDRPEDAVRLVARCREIGGQRIVFADRTRRSDSFAFLALYRLYQFLHFILTGLRVRVGNFSAVPASQFDALVTLPALWNHYAAAIFQAKLPREAIPTVRGKRYCGTSKMNLVSWVVHGLQAISVFIDVVAVRMLLFLCFVTLGCLGLLLAAFAAPVSLKFLYAAAGLLVLILVLGFACFSLSLGLLAQRNRLDFIPARDYRFFVEGCHLVR